ncbi:MAG: TonB-dependent receptor [Verrucomicrobiaceae bacterium]|nr:MAG: TonB-dependent receptor [Verrucomicrobiaceae bacterium]
MLPKPILFTLVAASIASGQDFLDPIFVTASRSERTESSAAYSTAYLDADFIRQNTRRTLPEALQYTPGVMVQKTAHGHGSPFIRGFTGRQNLLLVDGVRLNNSTLRSGPVQYWNTVDALAIDHLELIKSQGSVLYGSDAAGGTLNAFTKSSDFRARADGQTYLGGSASYEFRANGQGSHIGRLESETGVGGKFGLWLGLSAKDFGDIEDSAVGRMDGTGYPEEALDFRADWALTADSTLTLAHQSLNQDAISRWHRTLANPGWRHDDHVAAPGTWSENTYDQERSLTYLRYAGENPQAGAFIDRWNATLSWQSTADSEFQNRTPAEDSLRASNIEVETLGLDLVLESAAGPGTLVYGFDFYHDDVDSSGYRKKTVGIKRENLPVADDSEYDIFGTFAQYVWKPGDALEITTGARYTHAGASLGRFYNSAGALQESQSEDWDAVVGSLRGLYRINPQWSLFGGISQAFRAPNLDDLTGNMTSRAGNDSLGSTEVQPENFLTYELGVRQATENTSLACSVFYTDVSDLITGVPAAPGSRTTVTTNAADAYIYGVELEGAWRFHPQWTLSGFAAWQDGRLASPAYLGGPPEDKPMSRQLPLTGSVALRWTDPAEKFWIETRLLGAATEDRITAEDQAADNQRIPTHGTPGYLVASLRAGWQVNEHLDLTCGIENITDEDYRIHGSGQNEPGLAGIFAVKMTW